MVDYEEFSMLKENADEVGIPWKGTPKVERKFFTSSQGFSISGIFWGGEPPQLVPVSYTHLTLPTTPYE